MPSFTKAKTFAKCPWDLLLIFFLSTIFVYIFLTYFWWVAVGFQQVCIYHLEIQDLSCKKQKH